MIYQASVTTLKGREASQPLIHRLEVTAGLVYHLSFYFPPGSMGLLHCMIFDGLHQFAPVNPDETFHGDNLYLSFDDTYLKLEPPFVFDIHTYNADEEYAHTVDVRIGMVSKDIYIGRFLPGYGKAEAEKILADELARQEVARRALVGHPFTWLPTAEEGEVE